MLGNRGDELGDKRVAPEEVLGVALAEGAEALVGVLGGCLRGRKRGRVRSRRLREGYEERVHGLVPLVGFG